MQMMDESRRQLAPAAIAVAVALVGATAIFFMDFGSETRVQSNGISMVTAAAVERAGATVVPTGQQ
jgi:hypothetical protein